MKLKLSKIFEIFFTNKKIVVLILRIWTLFIFFAVLFFGYQMGFTGKYVSIENPDAFDSLRMQVADKGILGFSVLNIVQISLATALIVPIILMIVFCFCPKIFLKNKKSILLAYVFLFVLTVWSVFRAYGSGNYYGSRYFIPIVLPLMFFVFAYFIAALRTRGFKFLLLGVLVLVMFFFNFKHDWFLYKNKFYQNRFSFLEDLASNIPEDSYVFLAPNSFSQVYFQLPLQYLYNLNVIALNSFMNSSDNTDELSGVQERIKIYLCDLKQDGFYLISSIPFSENYIKKVHFKDSFNDYSILYPKSIIDASVYYYLYNLKLDLSTCNNEVNNTDSLL